MSREQWKAALKLRIYVWTVTLVKCLRRNNVSDYAVRSIIEQVIRSGTSVGANYIEAVASPSRNDFRKFLSYSLKSANETKYWLALMRDSGIHSREELAFLLKEACEISNILGKSVSTMYKK